MTVDTSNFEASTAGLTLSNVDTPPVSTDDLIDDTQPEPSPSVRRRVPGFEDSTAVLPGDSRSIILYIETIVQLTDRHRNIWAAVLDRVSNQILEHLFQPTRIRSDRGTTIEFDHQ